MPYKSYYRSKKTGEIKKEETGYESYYSSKTKMKAKEDEAVRAARPQTTFTDPAALSKQSIEAKPYVKPVETKSVAEKSNLELRNPAKVQESMEKMSGKDAALFGPRSITRGMGVINTGVLSTAKTALDIPDKIGAKIQGFVEGKDVEARKGFVSEQIDKQISRDEQTVQKMNEALPQSGPAMYISQALSSVPQVVPALVGGPGTLLKVLAGIVGFGTTKRESELSGDNELMQIGKGALGGAFELAGESEAIDNLVKMVDGDLAVKTILKQAGLEGVGEMITEALSPYISELTDKGAVKEAYTADLKKTAKQITDAGITGAVAGFLFSGAAVGSNYVQQAIDKPTRRNVQKVTTDVIMDMAVREGIITKAEAKMPNAESLLINRLYESGQNDAMLADVFAGNERMTELPSERPGGQFGGIADAPTSESMIISDAPSDARTEAIAAPDEAIDTPRETQTIGSESIAETALANNRITYDITTGKQPNKGYSVAIKESNEVKVPLAEYNQAAADEYIAANKKLLDQDGNHYGSWVQDGFMYQDTSHVVEDLDAAMLEARQKGELAIFNLETKEDIPIKGLGGELVNDDGTVDLFHYSPKKDIESVDPAYMGQSTNAGREIAAEFDTEGNIKDDYLPKAIFFTKETDGKEVHRFGMQQKYKSSVNAEDIYDIAKNPEKVEGSDWQKQVAALGYKGFIQNGQVRMFEAVPTEYMGKSNVNKYGKAIDGIPLIKPETQVENYDTPKKMTERIGQIVLEKYGSDTQIDEAISLIKNLELHARVSRIPMNLQMFAEALESLEGMKRSKTVETLMGSDAIPDKFKRRTKEAAGRLLFDYEQTTEQDLVNQARKEVAADFDGKYAEFMKIEKGMTNKEVAIAHELIRQAIAQDNVSVYNEITQKYAKLGTTVAKALHAMNMISIMTPEGLLNYANRVQNSKKKIDKSDGFSESVNNILQGNGTQDEKMDGIRKLVNEHTNTRQQLTKKQFIDALLNGVKEGKMTFEQIQLHADRIFGVKALSDADAQKLVDLMKEAQDMEEGRDRDVKIAEAFKVISDQMSTTFTQKFAALQRISMLLNARTNARNIIGNVGITTGEMLADLPIQLADVITSLKTGERSTTFLKWRDVYAGMEGYKKGLYEAFDDHRRGINTRQDMGQFEIQAGKMFEESHNIATGNEAFDKAANKTLDFTAKGLNKANDLTTFLLSAGDRPFYEMHFQMEMSRLSRVKKYKNNVSAQAETAHEIALQRTFQNRSTVANAAAKARSPFGIAGRIVVPYVYTPANIADKVFDYSPLGLTRVVGKNMLYDNFSADGKFDQREMSERIGRALTGSAIIYLGYVLMRAGAITGAYDDDEDIREFQKSVGMQDYAFVGPKGLQYTFDWAQPMAVPLAVGANLYKNGLAEGAAKEVIWDAIAQSSIESAQMLVEQPLLQGLRNIMGGYGSDSVVENTVGQFKSAPTQVIPFMSIIRQMRQVADPQKRFIDYNNQLERLRDSIPGLSQELPPKIGTLGQEMDNGETFGLRLFNAALNPGQMDTVKLTPVEELFMSTYAETDDATIFPRKAPEKDKDKNELTKAQQSEFNSISGAYIKDQLEILVDANFFEGMDADIKASFLTGIVKDAYDYSMLEIMKK